MNSKKKIKGFHLCVGFCLIMMLIFQGNILSFTTVNASDFLRTIETGSILSEEYACSFQITDNTRTETFGVDNTLRDSIDPKGVHAIEVQEIKDSSQKGKTGILYTNAGVYKGKIYDLKITLTDWGGIAKDKSPVICFYTDNLKIGLNAVKKAKFSFGFFQHGTEEEMKVKGHFTLTEENNDSSSTMLFERGFSVELECDSAKTAGFTFTPYQGGASEISTDLHQKVGRPGDSWAKAVKSGEKKPYEFCEYETFEYQFRHRLSPNRMKEYEMCSTLDTCLAVYGKEDVRVTDAFGEDVTEKFQIAIDGQTIICRAREKELEREGFTCEIYTFHLTVHRKRGIEIEEEHFQKGEDGFTFQIPGCARLSWKTADGRKDSITSTTAWVQSRMLAQLAVEQSAEYECKVGDIIDFTVLVSQTSVNARAINVQVENLVLPRGLQLIGNATASGAPDVNLERTESGWTLTCPVLDFNHVIAAVFQCKVTEDAAGQELLNTVTATADNYRDAPGNVRKTARDSQDIWVNAAVVSTQIRRNMESWEAGDEVICRLAVSNTQENTVASDVEVTDEILPEGLRLASVDGLKQDRVSDLVMYPISDKKTGILRKAVDNFWNVYTEGDSWKLLIDYLTDQTPFQIELKCIAEADSIENTSENVSEISEETEVLEENTGQWLEDEANSGEEALLVLNHTIQNRNLKENDNRLNNEYRVGEIVDYQITVVNQNPGTTAEHLIISNVSFPKGLQLQEGLDSVVWEGPEGVIAPEGTGWRLEIASLPYNMPVTIQYPCIIGESVNGMEIINTVSAFADNGQEVKSSTKIWVNSPKLQLSQKPDKSNCKYGDTITYQINLSQSETGCVSRNAAVEVLGTEGVKLRKKSIKVLDSQNSEIQCGVQVTGNNFIICTERDIVKEDYYSIMDAAQGETVQQSMWNPLNAMEDTHLTVEYQVTVTDAALAESEVISHVTVNSDENISRENDAILEIKTPVLKIEKKSDKLIYAVGESAFYTLGMTQTGEDTVARNIIVTDEFQSKGMTIVGDSLQLRLNGSVVEASNIEVEQNRFVIHTGKSMGDGDRLDISYQTVFDNPKLEGKTLINRAEIKSSETDAVSIEQKVYVGEKTSDIENKVDDNEKKRNQNDKQDMIRETSKVEKEEMKVSSKDKNAASEKENKSKAAFFFILIACGGLTSVHMSLCFRKLKKRKR